MKLLSLARSAAMLAGVAYFACAPATALADEKPANQEKHLLRYKFDEGDVFRWDVRHQVEILTTVAGTTQNAATDSRSVKKWVVEKGYLELYDFQGVSDIPLATEQ